MKKRTSKEKKRDQAIGARVAKARSKKKLTQEQLAERLSVSTITLSRYERGQIQLTLSMLHRVADLLAVGADVLLGIEAAPAGQPASKAEAEVVERFRDLDRKTQNSVLQILRKLSE